METSTPKPKGCVLTFEAWHGKRDIGSSRIRGHWVIAKWPEVNGDHSDIELYKIGGQYDFCIYQKAYAVEHARSFAGPKIFDLCDPDWLDWGYRFKEMIEACDAVTTSSVALADAVQKFTKKPVYFVPDRVELDGLPEPKVHVGETKTVVWYGYSHNYPVLDSCIPALARRGLKLIVVSDKPYNVSANFADKIEIENVAWGSQCAYSLQRGDVVLNPRWSKGKWKYKSDNKTTLAWAVGMPVAANEEELDALTTEAQRKAAAEIGLKKAREEYDVRLSAEDYKGIIDEIAVAKSATVNA